MSIPSTTTLIKGAIDGMLAALDPHSSYVEANDFDQLKATTDGNYGGLGLTVSMEDGVVKVDRPDRGHAGVARRDQVRRLHHAYQRRVPQQPHAR